MSPGWEVNNAPFADPPNDPLGRAYLATALPLSTTKGSGVLRLLLGNVSKARLSRVSGTGGGTRGGIGRTKVAC